MKSLFRLSLLAFLFIAACSAPASASPTQSQPIKATTYDDPFAYCAAVGTIDSPDAQYTGPKIPDSIMQGLIAKGVITADMPAEIQKNAVWRCMDAHVWACHFGANLPCLEKADISDKPTSEMEDFCKANPDVDPIPAAVTGRATVYEWKCTSGQPAVVQQIFQVDPQGYLANFWYELVPK
jgi:hypothetical protein